MTSLNFDIFTMENQSPETYVKLTIFIGIFAVGFIGNLLTIIVIYRKGQTRSPYQLLVLNLASSDLLFILSAPPTTSYELFAVIGKSQFYCRVVTPMVTMFYFLSIFTITSMAIQRCRSIVLPYRPNLSKKMMYAWIAAIWFLSFIIILPLAIVTELNEKSQCEENWPSFSHRQAYTMALFLLQYLIPLIIIATIYVKIARRLLSAEVSLSRARNASFTTDEQKAAEARRIKTRNQAIRTLAVVVIVFAICLFPGQISWLLMDFGGGGKALKKAVASLLAFSNVLDMLHACVNPVIYCLLNERYRKEYINCLVYLFRCNRENN